MRWLALAFGLVFLVGCGSGDSTRAERPETLTHDPISVTPTINACPVFETSLVLPQAIPVGVSAFVAVRAVDPDADDGDLKYEWTATSGEFTEPELAATEYRCDESGDQSLTVVTRDAADCDAELHIAVTCLSE